MNAACHSFVNPVVEVILETGQERRRDWSLNIVTDDFLSGTLVAVGKKAGLFSSEVYLCVYIRVQRSLMWMSNIGSCTLVLSFAMILMISVALFLAAV
jgi:hypothetical protein